MRAWLRAVGLASVMLVGCGDDTPAPQCVPNEPCLCENNAVGVTVCIVGDARCSCLDTPDTGADADTVLDTDAEDAVTPDASDAPDADAALPDGDDGDTDDAGDGDSDADADAADGSGALNACGGTRPLQWQDEPAEPGQPCGSCGQGQLYCNGTGALLCLGDVPRNACGGCDLLDGPPGESCGFCDGGVWSCTTSGGVECVGAQAPNACGGCNLLPAVPGEPCLGPLGEGTWACAGATAVACTADSNACGGLGELVWQGDTAEPGDACEDGCGAGVLACQDGALACISDAPRNACGGCGDLDGIVGAPCGLCGGVWQCDGEGGIACSRPPANGCGGCADNGLVPGEPCGEGVVLCEGTTPRCGVPGLRNDCGRLTDADEGAGETCGDGCGDGVVRCTNDGVTCSGESEPNDCGECGGTIRPEGTPCGRCAAGTWTCSDDGITCVQDPSIPDNACGGCATLRAEPGEACGWCDLGEYTCDPSNNAVVCSDNPGDTEPNACGGCTPLDGAPGDPCGPCGLDTLRCEGTEALECSGSTTGNVCGGCETFPIAIGAACGICGGGTFECDGRNAFVCTNPDTLNACGTCIGLIGEIGDPCGVCNRGSLACAADGLELECVGDPGAGALNACGGCGPLGQVPNTPCGTCGSGRWTCGADRESITCVGDRGDAARNGCGGCAPLPSEPNFLCGPCNLDTWQCSGTEALVCSGNTTVNDCGGCTLSANRLGDPCSNGEPGICEQGGEYVCVDETLVCDAPTDIDPLEVELCNEVDDDCDGVTDEGFDLANDATNCGACGVTCVESRSTTICRARACTVLDCEDGWADVDDDAANGCEACAPGFSGTNCEISCRNARLDGDETSVDCGGSCAVCALGVTSERGAVGAAATARLGFAVATAGDWVAAGAPSDPGIGPQAGAVMLYQRVGDGLWSDATRLVADTVVSGDRFGAAVAMSGPFLVIGAPGDDGLGADAGTVYLYENVGDTWIFRQELVASSGASGHEFGVSLAIDGTRVAVGAPGATSRGVTNNGAVELFVRGSNGFWTSEAILTPPTAATGDGFGRSVALWGATLAVGGPTADSGATNNGAVDIWRQSGAVWSRTERLTPGTTITEDRFGSAVALFEDTLVIGMPFADGRGVNSGQARVYNGSTGSFVLETTILPPTSSSGFEVGGSVSVWGDRVIVGFPGDTTSASRSGSVRVFERATAWTEQTALRFTPANSEDRAGSSCAAGAGVVVLGAPSRDVGASDAGRVLIVE